MLEHLMGAHPASRDFLQKTTYLLQNLQAAASKAYSLARAKGKSLMTAGELGRIQEVKNGLELIGATMAKIEEVKSNGADDQRVKQLKVASLSCLFLKPLSGRGAFLQVAASEPLGLCLV
mmetsp:Transcript_29857/g.45599  ORF Transcript_29857/g.45599 Transcript_29857/m.45599 type:complete len:120 (-) Transcript_29857:373-732(-)